MHRSLAIAAVLAACWPAGSEAQPPAPLAHPVLFVGQVPIPDDFATIGSTFANHLPDVAAAGRGGDLFVLYPDGELRNLTREAGFGDVGFQGADAISVRDPHVHWDGSKALFSMVIGAPTEQFDVIETYWQIYEVTGIGQGETAAVSLVANQPSDYDNLTPVYASDGRIVFTSDRPRSGERHLYPQHDEYESTPTNTGLWSLDPSTGDLVLLEHSPSGAFTPILDSFGRILFTRWDHLQRDQQADGDDLDPVGDPYGTFDWADESASAPILPTRTEVFPEPRSERVDLLAGTNLVGHRFNHFFPWEIRQDGRAPEVLSHIGRHELHDYFDRVFDDDPNLVEFIDSLSGRFNPNEIENMFQLSEDPTSPGRYFGVDAPEFDTHASGQIVSLVAPPGQPADTIAVTWVTHRDTSTVVGDGDPPPATHSGHYRDPLPLSDGRLVASHTFETRGADNQGTRANPIPRYDFRLRWLESDGSGHAAATVPLTSGIAVTVSYFDPDVLVTYSGNLWELSPVEIRTRPQPPGPPAPALPGPEAQIFVEEGIDEAAFRQFLVDQGLALIVSRNVTTRDAADRQQPFNLKVAHSATQTTGAGGLVYEVSHLQLFQADQLRGIGGSSDPAPGRRVLARPVHELAFPNPVNGGPEASVRLGDDGSLAAFVPTRRAVSWQLTDPAGTPVVRERYWLSFQPGEIRVCASCHGLSSVDQAGQTVPTNPPEALRELLQIWQAETSVIFTDGFESGTTTLWQ